MRAVKIVCFSMILFLASCSRNEAIPYFVKVGGTYYLQGGEKVTIVEIDPAGWIKVKKINDDLIWIKFTKVEFMKEVTPKTQSPIDLLEH